MSSTLPTLNIDVPNPTRRAMLNAGFVGLTALMLASKVEAKKGAQAADPGFNPTTYWLSPTARLVRRITYGGTQADFDLAHQIGYTAYLQQQLAYASIDDSACESWLTANLKTYGMDNHHLASINNDVQYSTVLNDLQRESLYRAIFSKRQLYERMVEFWTYHFNVNYGTVAALTMPYIRDAIRKNAMGRFQDLLVATAQNAAMLESLSTNLSVKSNPNQNYAREVMELHTLGLNNGYTQQDVIEVARCFTGWTYDEVTAHPTYGNFYFNESQHDQGTKTIFAGTPQQVNIPANGGLNDGVQVLSALANHPGTAQHIASQLCAWFLGDDVPAYTVTAVARVFTKYQGDLTLVLQEILKSDNITASAAKFKRPYHLIASAFRVTGCSAKPQQALAALDWMANMVSNMGMPLFQWPEPNGYPDIASYWSTNMLPRLSNVFDLLTWGQQKLIEFPAAVGAQDSPAQVVDDINAMLFNREMSPVLGVELDSVLHPLFNQSGLKYKIRTYAFSLALSSLDFQYY